MRVKLILIVAIVGGLFLLKMITPEVYHGYDAGFYGAMSRELISDNPKTTTAPYNYRVLAPWLLHILPLKTEPAFALYNLTLCALSAYLLFFLLTDTGGSYLEAGLGVFFFLFSWVNARFCLFYPIHIDGTYYFILILAFRSLLKKNDALFLIALILGAFTREYFLALIPIYYLFRKEKGCLLDRGALWKTLKLAGLPVIIFLSLRIMIPRSNQDFSYWSHAMYFTRMFFVHGRRILHSYLNIYGVVVFILLLHLGSCITYLKKNAYLAVYLLLSLLFLMTGGADRCRINFISFPAILILVVAAMKNHREIYRNPLMAGFLVAGQLFLMRVFRPMIIENYRRIWWSNVSFCPEAVFRRSLAGYGMVAVAFLLIYLGLYLRNSPDIYRDPDLFNNKYRDNKPQRHKGRK